MADIVNNATQAALAYRGAVEDYGNYVDMLMRQYGWNAKGPDGTYSVLNAQNAFDPDRVIQFDSSGSPQVNAAQIAQATGQGYYGTSGALANVAKAGAGQEAQAITAARMAGLGPRSGLATQMRQQAEAATSEKMGLASNEFLSSILKTYSDLTKKYQNVSAGTAEDLTSSAARRAGLLSLYNF
jgi:hypothetical protein